MDWFAIYIELALRESGAAASPHAYSAREREEPGGYSRAAHVSGWKLLVFSIWAIYSH
jgi:hypothetical protein